MLKAAVIVMAATGFIFYISPARAATTLTAQDTGEAYELVLQVSRDKETLTNTLLGLQEGFTGYYLPLKGLTELLDIYAEVDLAQGKAAGWFLKPDYTFAIDAAAGTYSVRGEIVNLAPDDIIIRDYGEGLGDMYVRFETLNKILPLEMEIDFAKLRLLLNTETKLPYELKKERELARARMIERRNRYGIDTEGFQVLENPYGMYSPPVVDLDTNMRWNNQDKELENVTNISGTNDLLGFSADYSANFQYKEKRLTLPEDLRFTMTRRVYDGDPMPLGVRELRLGDVSARTPDLVRGANGGRGVTISSAPFQRAGVFDEIVVEGTATPGWEIELYRSGELVDFGTVSETGQYRFEGVQLFGGNNQIKVMLYGPSGQVEERVEDHIVGGGLLSPGEVEYEAAVVDTTDNLISFEDEADSRYAVDDDHGIAYSGSARVGVNRWMSLFATGADSVTRMGKRKYASAGAELSLGGAQGHVEAYKEIGGGTALDTRLTTRLLGWRTNLRTEVMNGFESDRVGFDDDARVLNMQGTVSNRFSTGIGNIGITASADYEKLRDETTIRQYQLSKFLALTRQTYGNRLTARYRNDELNGITGLANANFRVNRNISTRGTLTYDVKPHFEFDTLTANIDYRHSRELSAGLDLSRNLRNTANGVGANINYDFGTFLGSLASNWRTDGGTQVMLRASTSLAPYGEDGDYIMRSRSLRSQNALNAKVFLDSNLNRVRDPGEQDVADAVMLFNRREMPPADENGFVNIVNGETGKYGYLTFKEGSTENPFHAASYPGYSAMLRPGVAQNVDFPLVETGIIDGTAYFEDGRPVPGLRLELVDFKGKAVKETITSYDGFYTFEFVKPGTYIIRAAAGVEATVPVQTVTISPDALFAYGVNVKLLKDGGLPPSEVVVDAEAARRNIVPVLGGLVRLQNVLRGAVSGG